MEEIELILDIEFDNPDFISVRKWSNDKNKKLPNLFPWKINSLGFTEKPKYNVLDGFFYENEKRFNALIQFFNGLYVLVDAQIYSHNKKITYWETEIIYAENLDEFQLNNYQKENFTNIFYKCVVSKIFAVTKYGSQFDAGLLSSKYPFLLFIVSFPILTLAPLFALPNVNLSYDAVSCSPVILSLFSSPYTNICSSCFKDNFIIASSINSNPVFSLVPSLINAVE